MKIHKRLCRGRPYICVWQLRQADSPSRPLVFLYCMRPKRIHVYHSYFMSKWYHKEQLSHFLCVVYRAIIHQTNGHGAITIKGYHIWNQASPKSPSAILCRMTCHRGSFEYGVVRAGSANILPLVSRYIHVFQI